MRRWQSEPVTDPVNLTDFALQYPSDHYLIVSVLPGDRLVSGVCLTGSVADVADVLYVLLKTLVATQPAAQGDLVVGAWLAAMTRVAAEWGAGDG